MKKCHPPVACMDLTIRLLVSFCGLSETEIKILQVLLVDKTGACQI